MFVDCRIGMKEIDRKWLVVWNEVEVWLVLKRYGVGIGEKIIRWIGKEVVGNVRVFWVGGKEKSGGIGVGILMIINGNRLYVCLGWIGGKIVLDVMGYFWIVWFCIEFYIIVI